MIKMAISNKPYNSQKTGNFLFAHATNYKLSVKRFIKNLGIGKTNRYQSKKDGTPFMQQVCEGGTIRVLAFQALSWRPGLKSQSKSALNSAVSEISKISALISAVSEWVKKTSADQRCFRAVQRWFSLNQRCSALDQNEVRNRRKCFV